MTEEDRGKLVISEDDLEPTSAAREPAPAAAAPEPPTMPMPARPQPPPAAPPLAPPGVSPPAYPGSPGTPAPAAYAAPPPYGALAGRRREDALGRGWTAFAGLVAAFAGWVTTILPAHNLARHYFASDSFYSFSYVKYAWPTVAVGVVIGLVFALVYAGLTASGTGRLLSSAALGAALGGAAGLVGFELADYKHVHITSDYVFFGARGAVAGLAMGLVAACVVRTGRAALLGALSGVAAGALTGLGLAAAFKTGGWVPNHASVYLFLAALLIRGTVVGLAVGDEAH